MIPESDNAPVVDVKKEHIIVTVLWADENGIIAGVSASLFGVKEPCLKGEEETFLYKLVY